MDLEKLPRCYPSGPVPAKILIVGEFPTAEEIHRKEPFVGASGRVLTDILHELDILRTECRLTNVSPWRPPRNDISKFFLTKTEATKNGFLPLGGKYPNQALRQGLKELAIEVAKTQPEIIIALGNTALWALTSEWGITKWRGSALTLNPAWEQPYDPDIRVIATYNPLGIMRSWDWRPVACYDISKAKEPKPKEPEWDWKISTSFRSVMIQLYLLKRSLDQDKLSWIAADIETRERTFVDCIGLAWSETEAICIPFFRASDYSFLWTEEQEAEIVLFLREIFLHPRTKLIGQNWYYDAQYIARIWGIFPIPEFDTMVAHAVAYPGTPKSLDYLSSIYLPWHRYWKDDTAEAEAEADDNKRWEYNCKDCCATWALREPIEQTLRSQNLWQPWEFERDLFRPLMAMIMKGVRLHEKRRQEYLPLVLDQQADLETFFQQVQAEAFPDLELAKTKTAKPWYRSPTQMVKLLYQHLHLPTQYHKKTKRPTTDEAALAALMKKEPIFAPLFSLILDYRSLGVFLTTFLLMPMDRDRRWRTSYNPVGTETFRLNSKSDSFGMGGNLQNIPTGDD